jgi:hypothetical protein
MLEPNFTVWRNQTQSRQNHSSPDWERFCQQCRYVDREARITPNNEGIDSAIRQFIEPLTIFSDNGGCSCNGRAGGRTTRQVEFGQHLSPNAIAGIAQIFVGLVVDPALTTRLQVTTQLCSPHLQQRPNNRVTTRVDSTETREARPTNELEQEGLGLVIPSVTDSDAIRRDRFSHSVKEVVPQSTRGVLHRQPLSLRVRGDINGLHSDREADTLSEIPAKLFVAPGRAAKTMIQMCQRHDAESVVFGKLPEQEHQRD